MARAQRYEVEYDDGTTVEVTVDGRDLLYYEETSGESALDLIVASRNVSTWYTQAYAAMRRQGLFDGTPEQFRDRVVFVLPVTSPDPTQPTTREEGSVS
jgi:hypothetical protein